MFLLEQKQDDAHKLKGCVCVLVVVLRERLELRDSSQRMCDISYGSQEDSELTLMPKKGVERWIVKTEKGDARWCCSLERQEQDL